MQEFRVKMVAWTVIYLSGRGSDKHLGSKNILKIELGGLLMNWLWMMKERDDSLWFFFLA